MTKGIYTYQDYLELDADFVSTVEAINLAEIYSKIKHQQQDLGKNKKEVEIKMELSKQLRDIASSFK